MAVRNPLAPLRDSEAGFGLISALLFVLLISAALAPLAIAGRVQSLSAAYTHERREFEILADGVVRAIYFLSEQDRAPLRWQRCETARYVFYLDIQDQSGLIDLNSAGPQLLQFGFRGLGLSEANAAAAAAVVEQYRSPGGYTVDVRGPPAELKHAPFEDVTELADITTAATIPMSEISRFFTVFNRTDTVALRHIDIRLRQIIEEGRGSEFLVEGAQSSSVSEVSVMRFRKGRPSGFMLRAMMTRAEGGNERMLRRSLSVIEEGASSIPSPAQPCRGVGALLLRSYDS
ncbi:general secretion pathway protein GspK [Sinorhizobium meliloti]|uniref:general secretion pathway protein GspK n=1 Tax=Rhizobium meliloti TaxID=382 RepID=UPI001F1B24B2|nr:general secretion pathway protein GspK [Sinorhizobium meliloti]